MYKRILVTLDRSKLSEAVMPQVLKLLSDSSAEVTLLTVAERPEGVRKYDVGLSRPLPGSKGGLPHLFGQAAETPGYTENPDQALARAESEAKAYLAEIAKQLEGKASDIQLAVRFGEAEDEIVEFAREGVFDLIVMATHGRSGLSGLVQGSVAASVLRSGVAPVLLVRPH